MSDDVIGSQAGIPAVAVGLANFGVLQEANERAIHELRQNVEEMAAYKFAASERLRERIMADLVRERKLRAEAVKSATRASSPDAVGSLVKRQLAAFDELGKWAEAELEAAA